MCILLVLDCGVIRHPTIYMRKKDRCGVKKVQKKFHQIKLTTLEDI